MKKLETTSRILLGLIFAIFGFNHFVPFIPHPEMTGDALTYMTGLSAVGYFWPLLRALELLCGLALLSNRFVPLALSVLAPITLHITLFHLFSMPANLPLAIVMTLAHGYLVKRNWSHFSEIFKIKTNEV